MAAVTSCAGAGPLLRLQDVVAWLGYEAASAPGGRVAMAADLGIPRPEEFHR